MLLIVFSASRCAAPVFDASALGKKAAIDAVNTALSHGDCATALAAILPVYASTGVDNNVRMATASAYACSAHINFFNVINALTTLNLSSGLFGSMAQLFPSVAPSGVLQPGDAVVESASYATDALQAALIPGAVVALSNYVNYPGNNPASVLNRDHIVDANDYLAFVGMAGVGGIENRYGAPDVNHNKTQKMFLQGGAEIAATGVVANGDPCLFAASTLNLIDGLQSISANAPPGGLVSNLNTALTVYNVLINAACESGCRGVNTIGPGWAISSGCALTAGTCAVCPSTLRNKANCKASNTDVNSCAAVGLINFVNAPSGVNPFGW